MTSLSSLPDICRGGVDLIMGTGRRLKQGEDGATYLAEKTYGREE
ncbi:MAG: hypothetical protein Q9M91_00610 [Candidatus Dojkabacteria bacterium]|nr:hypothetical protein [Candidatus Dojkabacteria bacterium]MDQ7020331.1 hypothetical protein [Candidatus Dojkabacteria bacterium]